MGASFLLRLDSFTPTHNPHTTRSTLDATQHTTHTTQLTTHNSHRTTHNSQLTTRHTTRHQRAATTHQHAILVTSVSSLPRRNRTRSGLILCTRNATTEVCATTLGVTQLGLIHVLEPSHLCAIMSSTPRHRRHRIRHACPSSDFLTGRRLRFPCVSVCFSSSPRCPPIPRT